MPSIQKYTPSGGTAYIFSSTGRPHYSVSSTYEAAGSSGHGLPRRKIVRHRLVQWFKEPSFADNQARYAALKTALANAEGVLYLEDEGGSVRVNARVRVRSRERAHVAARFYTKASQATLPAILGRPAFPSRSLSVLLRPYPTT